MKEDWEAHRRQQKKAENTLMQQYNAGKLYIEDEKRFETIDEWEYRLAREEKTRKDLAKSITIRSSRPIK